MKILVEYHRGGGKKKVITDSNGNFVRYSGGRRLGAMVAVPIDPDTVSIGWTKCKTRCKYNKSKYIDSFDKEMAVNAAIGRAFMKDKKKPASSMVVNLSCFIKRAQIYYKDKNVFIPWQDQTCAKVNSFRVKKIEE